MCGSRTRGPNSYQVFSSILVVAPREPGARRLEQSLHFISNAENEGHSMPEQPGPAPRASSAFSIIHILPLLHVCVRLAGRAVSQIDPNKSAERMLLGLKLFNGAFRRFRQDLALLALSLQGGRNAF